MTRRGRQSTVDRIEKREAATIFVRGLSLFGDSTVDSQGVVVADSDGAGAAEVVGDAVASLGIGRGGPP